MGWFSKLFGGGKRDRVAPAAAPSHDNPKREEEVLSKPVELTEDERNLSMALRIDEATGLQLKTRTQHKLEGLFKQFLEDGDKEPELRGIRSLYLGKDAAISRLNDERSTSDIHFFDCGGGAYEKNSYIAVVKTADRYDMLEIMETNGVNYGVSTEDIVAFLKRWEPQVPFLITRCETDTLVIRLDSNNPHLPEMVKEAIAICPDLTAGDDTPEAFDEVLAFIRKSGEIHFWWD